MTTPGDAWPAVTGPAAADPAGRCRNCGSARPSGAPLRVTRSAVSRRPWTAISFPKRYQVDQVPMVPAPGPGIAGETAAGVVSERLRLFRALTSRVKVQGETENFRDVLTPEIFRGVPRTLTRRSARKSRSRPPVHIIDPLLKSCSIETGGGTERGNNAGGR